MCKLEVIKNNFNLDILVNWTLSKTPNQTCPCYIYPVSMGEQYC